MGRRGYSIDKVIGLSGYHIPKGKRNIVVTVPKDRYEHMEDKLDILYEGGMIWWEISRKPAEAGYGSKIYFVMNKRISMVAIISGIGYENEKQVLYLKDLKEIDGPPCEPFRGFRYANM